MAKPTKTQSTLRDGQFEYGDVEMTDEEYQESLKAKPQRTISQKESEMMQIRKATLEDPSECDLFTPR